MSKEQSTADASFPSDIPIEQLIDLTGRVSVVVTLTGRDNFANEFQYDVTLKNQSTDSFLTRSLILVLEQVTDLAGKEAMERMEVLGQEGLTSEGKPYFRLPPGEGRIFPPYSESQPVTVRLRNAAYTIIFTPSFKVFGLSLPASKPSDVTPLIRLLIQKGFLTDDEWQQAAGSKP